MVSFGHYALPKAAIMTAMADHEYITTVSSDSVLITN